jgi:hypothetical protein
MVILVSSKHRNDTHMSHKVSRSPTSEVFHAWIDSSVGTSSAMLYEDKTIRMTLCFEERKVVDSVSFDAKFFAFYDVIPGQFRNLSIFE